MRTEPTRRQIRARYGVSERGFTILEVLIAAVVLSVGVIAVLGMQTIATIASRSTNNMRNASRLADAEHARPRNGEPRRVGPSRRVDL
jgi:prepilin-type N-terminal cleavage/methylation domain-containing protein